MKYILTLILLILFTGCNKNTKQIKNVDNNNTNISVTTVKKHKTQKKLIIKIDNLKLTFINNNLIYPKNKIIILFDNNNTYSKAQKLVLQKLKITYYTSDSKYLKNYFNIQYYPTIIVLDNNKTVKYENFTPYEILKTEGF